MKKYFLLIITLLLTGCFGEVGKGYITKKCTKEENINGYNKTTIIYLKSKQDEIEEIKIEEIYDESIDLSSINDSKKSEENLFNQIKGATIEINNNKFTYIVNLKESNDIIKEKFEIEEKAHKQLKKYEEQGYVCK